MFSPLIVAAAGSVVSLNKSALMAALTFNSLTDASNAATGSGITIAASLASSAIDIGDISVSFFTKASGKCCHLRAENGATMTRLQFAEDHLRLSNANLEAANSRIMDVDVATESTALAKYNILSQASASHVGTSQYDDKHCPHATRIKLTLTI